MNIILIIIWVNLCTGKIQLSIISIFNSAKIVLQLFQTKALQCIEWCTYNSIHAGNEWHFYLYSKLSEFDV